KSEDEGSLFNEMRFGLIPCQLMTVVSPGSILRITESQNSLAALENLVTFRTALIKYGMETKTVIKPLEFINATAKGDETMIKNIVNLAIMSTGRGFTVPNFNVTQAKDLMESLSTPPPPVPQKEPSADQNDATVPATPLAVATTTTSNDALNSTSSLNQDPTDPSQRVLQRIEAMDAGTSRLLRTLVDSFKEQQKESQRSMERLGLVLDAVARRLATVESVQTDILTRMQSRLTWPASGVPGHRPISLAESEVASSDEESIGRANKEGAASPEVDPKKFLDKTRRHVSQESSLGQYSSSPSLLASSPIPLAKMFPRLPADIVNSGLPKPELLRLSVIYEFIDTERDFVNDLGTMINYHKNELKQTKMITEQDINMLFSNVETLIETNSYLLNKLQAKKEANPVVEGIGEDILEVADKLKVYTVYCGNYPYAMKLVHQLQARPDFKEHMQKMMSSAEGRGLSLESFLIKPVQRICKYPLLIRELLKNTDKSVNEYRILEQAMQKIEAVVTLVNEATSVLDRKERVQSLLSKLDSPVNLNALLEKKLWKDGIINRIMGGKSKERFFMLFTDVVLVCKAPVKNRHQLENMLYTGELSFKTDAKSDASTRGLRYFFQLYISTDRKEFMTLSFNTEDERSKWHDAFTGAMKTAAENPTDPALKRLSDTFDASGGKVSRNASFRRGQIITTGITGVFAKK
ncbi:cytochrome c oxidase subunit 1, partial [Blyttiomyces sp. JEL0837]